MVQVKPNYFQRLILRPAVVGWALLSVLMLILTLVEIHPVPGLTQKVPLPRHRINVGSREWTATEQVIQALPGECCVRVETDNDIFFYLLRYQLYPSRVYNLEQVNTGKVVQPGQPDYVVSYYADSLHVRRLHSE